MDFDNKLVNDGVYVIFDSLVEQYGNPFVSSTIENAKRMAVAHLLTFPDNFIGDQCLYEIGQYNPNNATIEGYESKVLVAGSKQLLEKVYELREEYAECNKQALDEIETLKKLQKGKEAKK